MDLSITSGKLAGTVSAPPSKSVSHRAVIAAALSPGQSTLRGVALSDDIRATIGAVTALGAQVVVEGDTLYVTGIDRQALPDEATVDCIESGSTLRFLIPIAAALGVKTTYLGQGRLPSRPISAYLTCFAREPIDFAYSGTMPFTVSGKLSGRSFSIEASTSSQYITGLLMALPLLPHDTQLTLTGPVASEGYIHITLQILKQFGITICKTASGFAVPGGQQYRPCDLTVEGDFSNGAFWLVASALGSPLTTGSLSLQSTQGDSRIVDIIGAFGGKVSPTETGFVVETVGGLHGATISCEQIPDLVPAIALLGCVAQGETLLTGGARLRIKESDRLATVTQGLCALGAQVEEGADFLRIHGTGQLKGGISPAFGDHRIAMMLAIAATISTGPVTITGAECVRKSYPAFFETYQQLGGVIHVI